MTTDALTEPERAFADDAVRRERVFAVVSGLGVLVGLAVLGHALYLRLVDDGASVGLRFVLGVLILLNARLNLRQHRYARVLRKLLRTRAYSLAK